MDWDTIKLFLALHRAGSARAAAAELKVSASTITRQVSQLEKSLNVKLFNRTKGGCDLTDHGTELLEVAKRMEKDAFDIQRRLQAKNGVMQGIIRITFPNHLMHSPLIEYFEAFSRIHPKVAIHLIPSFSTFNLTRGEADIAIRMFMQNGTPPEELIGTKLMEVHCANYASETYLKKHVKINEKDGGQWLGWGEPDPHPDWVKTSAYPHLPTHHHIREPLGQLYAAKAGLGIAMLPCFLCDKEPDLVRSPRNLHWHRFDLWMLSHPDLRDTARFKALRLFLKTQFIEDKKIWMGES